MSTVAKYWRLGRVLLRSNLASAMEYRTSFFSQIVFMFVNDLLLLFFWWVLFTRFGEIKGWQRGDVFLLYSLHAASYGMGAVLFGNANRLARMISDGGLDSFLALPKDPLFHILMSHSVVAAMGDYLFGLVVTLAVRPTLAGLLFFLLTTTCGGLVYVSFAVVAHSLAFWLGNSDSLSSNLVEMLHYLSLYPESIYPGTVRLLVYTLIPSAYMSFVPVRLLRGFNFVWLVVMVGATALSVTVGIVVFRHGLKRYESGNLVGYRT